MYILVTGFAREIASRFWGLGAVAIGCSFSLCRVRSNLPGLLSILIKPKKYNGLE
jgi:hypothetical protein